METFDVMAEGLARLAKYLPNGEPSRKDPLQKKKKAKNKTSRKSRRENKKK